MQYQNKVKTWTKYDDAAIYEESRYTYLSKNMEYLIILSKIASKLNIFVDKAGSQIKSM